MNEVIKKGVFGFGVFVIGILLILTVSANSFGYDNTGAFANAGSSSQYFRPSFNSYYSSEQIGTYWPILNEFDRDTCEASTDFLIAIPPVGCEPAVVRSDLLEEQNVPVFCQLDALQVNPLIKVSSIESINFKGDYPEGVAGISFHPARAAVRTHEALLGSPLLNNIGYVVIVMKRNEVEDNMPDFVSGNLTATIRYDAEEAFGAGRAEFLLPSMTDSEWEKDYKGYSFWNGRGFVRVHSITEEGARVGLYSDKNRLIQEISLKKGQTSNEIYFPGFYCKAGLRVRLNGVDSAETKVRLNVEGEDLWVSEGSKFLDGKCSVSEIKPITHDTGSVNIRCSGNPSFELFLSRNGANFSDDFVKVGEKVGNTGEYLLYVGEVPEEVSGMPNRIMAITTTDASAAETEDLKLAADVISNYVGRSPVAQEYFKNKVQNSLGKEKIRVYFDGEEGFNGFGSELNDSNAGELEDEFAKLFENATELATGNLNNEQNTAEDFYGEMALWDAVRSAKTLEKEETQAKLLKLIIENYPSSDLNDYAQSELRRLTDFDMSQSGNSVYVNNRHKYISLEAFDKAGLDEKNVVFNVFGGEQMGEGDEYCFDTKKSRLENEGTKRDCTYLRVVDIDRDRVRVYMETYDKQFLRTGNYGNGKSATLYLKGYGDEQTITYQGNTIFVRDINVEEEASISILPRVENTRTEANFSFKVGIEKRNIDLSPKKTEEMIKNLDEAIEEWEDRLEKLGKVITAWKGACFATSGFLMISNFVSNLNGEAIGRKKVMEKYGVICDDAITKGSVVDAAGKSTAVSTRTACYNALSKDIEEDVARSTEVIKDLNTELTPKDGEVLGDGILGGKSVDREPIEERFAKEHGIAPELAKHMTLEEMRDYAYWQGMEDSNVDNLGGNYATERANSIISPAENRLEREKNKAKLAEGLGIVPTVLDEGSRNVASMSQIPTNSQIAGLSDIPLEDGQIWQVTNINGRNYVVLAERYASSNSVEAYHPKSNIYELKGPTNGAYSVDSGANLLDEDVDQGDKGTAADAQEILSKYSFVNNTCQNEYKEAKVKFYQSSPNKFLPSIVPFDRDQGWYVKVSQSEGGVFSDNVQGYQSSGAVSHYTICNVGPNNREENTLGDDICQSYSIHSDTDVFGGCTGLTSKQVENLKNNAMNAIQSASQQYGKDQIRIDGENYDTLLTAAGASGLECQDFMSAKDCKLLFNMCDPVICPASRCNLGGKYAVSNVVQSGILGSLLLCLPNIKEGVMVPICLTGVHAGLEGYVSILKSEQACLQESLDTGRTVGICDEITSVYTCEFFWRQMAPVTDIVIPKIFEFASGNSVKARGGAEYLSVQASWQNMQESVDFWKNSYAQNSFNAFKFRNIQEVGSEICRANVGTSVPGGADLVDGLLAPESPTQFYAQFDETPLTDVTLPPTSQYKVYYHIFAGNDKGSSYSVYLKNPPESSYYHNNPYVTVKSGYVARGEQVDEAIDFSAPAGYKELCVVIDAQTECGFQSVTTSFAVDYVRDKYVADQAKQESITTEKECIAGSPSLYSLANLNVGAGASDAINPNIELDGITRVCATDNPSKGVDELRWKRVGFCGSNKMSCWLDTSTVEDAVERVNAIEGATADKTQEVLTSKKVAATYRQTVSELTALKNKINGLNAVKQEEINNIQANLTRIYKDATLNQYKAEALYYKVKLYARIVELSEKNLVEDKSNEDLNREPEEPKTEEDQDEKPEETDEPTPEVTEPEEEKVEYGLSNNEKNYIVGPNGMSLFDIAKDISTTTGDEIIPRTLYSLNPSLDREKYGDYSELVPADTNLTLP